MTRNVPTDKALYARVKAEAKRRFKVYPCVPLHTQAVAKFGPISRDKIYPGEEILAYDKLSGDLVWSEVESINFYDDAPMVKIGKRAGFSITCTPNHEWVVESRYNGAGQPNIKMVETSKLNTHTNIVWCGNPLNPDTSSITKYWSNNWSKKDDWVQKALAMTPLERECFLASAIVYDGCEQSVSRVRANGRTFAFTQKKSKSLLGGGSCGFLQWALCFHVSKNRNNFWCYNNKEQAYA